MKRGFTLIEVIVCMGIISIILLMGAMGLRSFKKISNEINEEELYYEIMDFICYGRKYSYNYTKKSVIEIKREDENIKLIFSIDNRKIKESSLKSEIGVYTKDFKEKLNNKIIYINEQGYIKPTTICFRGSNNKEREITLGVGGNNTSFKEKREGKWVNIS